MNRPRFSPARTVAAVALLGVSGFYAGAMADNVLPHGADKARWEPSSTSTSPRMDVTTTTTAVPGSISTVNVPDGRCHEDDPCWDCSTMGNLRCGPLPEVP